MEVFSTITSTVFSELVVVLAGDGITCLPHEVTMFETLRKMNEVRPFKLVFLFEGPSPVPSGGRSASVEARWKLKEALDYVVTNGFLNFLDSSPIIRVVTRVRHYQWDFPDLD